MLTIKQEIINEFIINKSTFITYLNHVESLEEAKTYIEMIKGLNKDATHHVTCYIIGKTGEIGNANDDGEPSGTAALPALNVFRLNDITNFVCIIVRYFGGIKLGAGGLVRAYAKSASEALKKATIVAIIDYSCIKLMFNYSYLELIQNKLKNYQILNSEFSTNVCLTIKIPTNEINGLINLLVNLTNNQIKWEKIIID